METSNYITPTKKNILFKAECDYFGYIENTIYKDMLIGNCVTSTFATSYIDAVNMLHEWIKENDWVKKEYPKAKFNIYSVDGSLDKNGERLDKKVYTISASKAKKFIWI